MLRPGIVRMRGSTVIRLRPCMRLITYLLSGTPPPPPTHTHLAHTSPFPSPSSLSPILILACDGRLLSLKKTRERRTYGRSDRDSSRKMRGRCPTPSDPSRTSPWTTFTPPLSMSRGPRCGAVRCGVLFFWYFVILSLSCVLFCF